MKFYLRESSDMIPHLPSTNWACIEEEQLEDAAADQDEKELLGVGIEEGGYNIEEAGNSPAIGMPGQWPTEI